MNGNRFKKILLCTSVWKSLYNISLKYALFYLWVFYRINLKCTSPGFATEWEVILFFFLFLILKIQPKSELLPWFETGRGGQGGLVRHACLYISEPFLSVKAVHFWEVLIFLFPFSFKHFCSELLFYIAGDWEEYRNMWRSFKNCSAALLQYTKDFDKKRQC